MAVTQIQIHAFSGVGNGYHTRTVNMPPSRVMVQASLRGTTGGGTQFAGLKGFRRRLPSGADEDVNLGEWPSWPSSAFDNMSSVTLALACGADQSAWGTFRIEHWS